MNLKKIKDSKGKKGKQTRGKKKIKDSAADFNLVSREDVVKFVEELGAGAETGLVTGSLEDGTFVCATFVSEDYCECSYGFCKSLEDAEDGEITKILAARSSDDSDTAEATVTQFIEEVEQDLLQRVAGKVKDSFVREVEDLIDDSTIESLYKDGSLSFTQPEDSELSAEEFGQSIQESLEDHLFEKAYNEGSTVPEVVYTLEGDKVLVKVSDSHSPATTATFITRICDMQKDRNYKLRAITTKIVSILDSLGHKVELVQPAQGLLMVGDSITQITLKDIHTNVNNADTRKKFDLVDVEGWIAAF